MQRSIKLSLSYKYISLLHYIFFFPLFLNNTLTLTLSLCNFQCGYNFTDFATGQLLMICQPKVTGNWQTSSSACARVECSGEYNRVWSNANAQTRWSINLFSLYIPFLNTGALAHVDALQVTISYIYIYLLIVNDESAIESFYPRPQRKIIILLTFYILWWDTINAAIYADVRIATSLITASPLLYSHFRDNKQY